MGGTLVLVMAIVTVPLFLLLLRGLFLWRYQRTLRKGMATTAADTDVTAPTIGAVSAARTPLKISRINVSAARLSSNEASALGVSAARTTHHAHLAFVIAAIVYSVPFGIAVFSAMRPSIPTDAKIMTLYLSFACVVFIVLSVLCLPRNRSTLIAAMYLGLGVVMMLLVSTPTGESPCCGSAPSSS